MEPHRPSYQPNEYAVMKFQNIQITADEYDRKLLSISKDINTKLLNILFDANVNVNKAVKWGGIPLCHAAENSHSKCIELLLSKPIIDVN